VVTGQVFSQFEHWRSRNYAGGRYTDCRNGMRAKVGLFVTSGVLKDDICTSFKSVFMYM